PLPTTFECSRGFTRYWLEASVYPIRFDFDQKAILPFSIASHDIAFNEDKYLNSVTISKPESFLCCSCCPRKRKVHYSLAIDRTVYHPGDSILFSGEIRNNSKETITGQICIYQRVTYHTKSDDDVEERTVEYKVLNDVERMESKTWTNSSILIPPIPPSSNGRLIDIGYQVEMKLKIGVVKEKILRIPIHISSAQVETKQFGGFSYFG
ncbi:arrestin domain-containing protein 3-like, partial [Anneissia japonica]|uniref:arrestin domain-containing protein 3-like n=1 Tax=Anneissia japonica TaxID=1529436 RepID=UPI001425A169